MTPTALDRFIAEADERASKAIPDGDSCAKCGEMYVLHDGYDRTPECDSCAQWELRDIRATVLPRALEMLRVLRDAAERSYSALHSIRGWYLEDMPAEGWEVMRQRDRARIKGAMTEHVVALARVEALATASAKGEE